MRIRTDRGPQAGTNRTLLASTVVVVRTAGETVVVAAMAVVVQGCGLGEDGESGENNEGGEEPHDDGVQKRSVGGMWW